jgi:hypothetical protein
MSLIVEDGTIVAFADSYVSRADYIAYAQQQGVVVPDTDETDSHLVRAARFIDSMELRLKGTRVDRDQPMAYPRKNLVIDGYPWAEDEIPRQVILAQMATSLDIASGVDPYNRGFELPVIEERVEGAVSVKYASPTTVSKLGVQSTATALLRSLMKSSGLFSVPLVRV